MLLTRGAMTVPRTRALPAAAPLTPISDAP